MSPRVSHETPSPTHSTCLTITQFSWNFTNNISCFSFHTYHMHTSIQSNKIIAYYLTALSFQTHSGIHTKHGQILWAKKIINSNIESHQPTQQSLSQHLAQAKGPRLGERVPFAQATPPRLGESTIVATARFQRVLAQATASRLGETAPRSILKPVA